MASLALRLLLALAASMQTAPSVAGAARARPSVAAAQEDPVLAELGRLLVAAREAQAAGDHELARSTIGGAIELAVEHASQAGDYATVSLLKHLAFFAHGVGELRAAERGQAAVVEALARIRPDDHHELLRAQQNLAAIRYALGDLRGARDVEERVVEVFARTLPEDHPDLLRARGNLAGMLADLGDLHGARALQEAVLEVHSRTLPVDHPSLQTARHNLARTMYMLGELHGARALQEAVLEARSRALSADHPDVQSARGNLAATKYDLGDLAGARVLVEAVLEAYSRTLPDDHPNLRQARGNLAPILLALGDLHAARVMLEAVLEACSRTLPADHPELQRARGNLAATLEALGDVHGARVLFEAVLEVEARTLPDDHPGLQTSRLNLAATMHSLGDVDGARSLQEVVLEVLSRTLPDDHPDLQFARANLADTLRPQGDLVRARELEEAVLEVRARTLPGDHRDLQRARENLAETIAALGDLAGARALLETALEVQLRTLPEDHGDLQQTRAALARVLLLQVARDGPGGPERELVRERCVELLGARCRSQTKAARTALLTSSWREAEERCAGLAGRLGIALSLAEGYGVFTPTRQVVRDAFVLSETSRGAALAAAAIARRVRGTPDFAPLKEALRDAGVELAALAREGGASDDYRRALARREDAERKLAARALDLLGEDGVAVLDVEALSAGLDARTALVGFRRFPRKSVARVPSGDAGTEEVRETSVLSLCAFVLRGGDDESSADVALVPLGPLEAIDAAVHAWREAIGSGAEREILLASRGTGAEGSRDAGGTRDAADTRGAAVVTSAGADAGAAVADGYALRRLVWDPLLPALGDAERVVVALDDVLHLVPIDALPLDRDGALVGDRWRIETRVGLWEVMSDRAAPSHGGALVALGGAAFDAQPVPLAEQDLAGLDHERAATTEVASLLRGGAWESGFGPLTYTGVEAREIAALHDDVFADQGAALVLEERQASRSALEETASRARWLHVATHGWFAPESIRSWSDVEALDAQHGLVPRLSSEETVRGMSPMLLCGLALAGANLPADAVGRVPGLITAEELSTLDLSRCELAVLSACDTAVGERRAGQGVASLQKALHMAGARSVITSLWKVPDEATRELMLDFYRRIWVEQQPKAQALWEAKRHLREATDERGRARYATRDWAAWVLTGEPD